MNAKSILEKIQNHKGQHVRACWDRPMKTRKDVSFIVTKHTCAHVRAGIDYSNLKANEGIETGELPWGEWVQFPFTIAHNGVEYVRLYPSVFANLKTTVEYFANGAAISAETAKLLCLASEFRERDEPIKCFTLKAENLVYIGE